MKKGDLVNFYSTVAVFQKDYVNRNPGVVVATKNPVPGSPKHSHDRGSAYILWANGELTKEHLTYLQKVK